MSLSHSNGVRDALLKRRNTYLPPTADEVRTFQQAWEAGEQDTPTRQPTAEPLSPEEDSELTSTATEAEASTPSETPSRPQNRATKRRYYAPEAVESRWE